MGATVGLGVGISVAAVAAIASQHLHPDGPTLLEKLGLGQFKQRRPLKAERWCEACDSEGKVTNFQGLLEDISRGGVCPSIRATVWPFLLGLADPDSTAAERSAHSEALRERHARLTDLCKALQKELVEGLASTKVDGDGDGDAGESGESASLVQADEYKENRRILNLDLVRTDFSSMNLTALSGNEGGGEGASSGWNERLTADARAMGVNDHVEGAEYLSREQKQCAKYMGKLLLCYSVHDPQTGYCQGMTDLVQPFAQIFQEEARSFWAFERFMRTARENFMTDESGISKRISQVKMVMCDLAPDLFEKLNRIGAESFFFTYRMILVFLRRELSLSDSILFLELMWAEEMWERKEEQPEFVCFCIVALVMERSNEIMTACKAESDVVHMFCNLKINVWHMVEEARFIRDKWLDLP